MTIRFASVASRRIRTCWASSLDVVKRAFRFRKVQMSDLWINWRFGTRHLQVKPNWPFVTFRVNPWWVSNPPEKWFEVF
jgi:hypothetical protein